MRRDESTLICSLTLLFLCRIFHAVVIVTVYPKLVVLVCAGKSLMRFIRQMRASFILCMILSTALIDRIDSLIFYGPPWQ
jgi:hypothetical protein